LQDDPSWQQRIADPTQSDAIFREINAELTEQCERLARSLSRLFTIGGLGKLAKTISPYISHFINLGDYQLGTTNYEAIRI